MKIVVFIVVLIPFLYAIPITGAFGLKLGQVFNVKKAKGVVEEHNEPPFYLFAPTSPVHELDTYYVRLTPADNRVYEIWGIKYFEKHRECKAVEKKIVEILTKKYGDPVKREKLAKFFNPYTKFQTDDNTIVVDCNGFTKHKLSVVYTNAKVEKKVEKVDNMFDDNNISGEGY